MNQFEDKKSREPQPDILVTAESPEQIEHFIQSDPEARQILAQLHEYTGIFGLSEGEAGIEGFTSLVLMPLPSDYNIPDSMSVSEWNTATAEVRSLLDRLYRRLGGSGIKWTPIE